MKITTIEFSHRNVSIYAHSFESEAVTTHVKSFLSTFQKFKIVAHELSPGLGRVTICSTNPNLNPLEFLESIGKFHLHFSTGKTSIEQDVIVSSLRNPEKRIAAIRLMNALQNIIYLSKPEFISA
ncbi:hypothetical protein LEP1GSC151_2770 [Leptospira interrogans serovar Grippotyphosa str. LT2186]|uniref:Uncharacterized protein n=1 Tax=Leptospira interrogans serovar Grippotyphosa str. LT2186 TaxID=1001599 RepID=M3FXB8_LEPIR|nr:hypothetical protein [Leptospira interrogans]EJP12908.1 hypothetical protein LEP1GSC080_0806 [Leptospira interrogans str. FPW2026]EKR46100.1 hypothetical protein LEP1GSC097_0971 [Leptospira interrogans serovar Grippotyphosa str. UI 08368]EMG12149.1 hypothetical protein LEP1GSC151_2770 [Leptospira interrogans serovar Grippotyphosa str. LT2186]EMN83712.1 hypothetical protein LEP1GSC107_1232 [Leptospira interrogans serovar Grippotyphosa str. UI 12769]